MKDLKRFEAIWFDLRASERGPFQISKSQHDDLGGVFASEGLASC